jgi:pantothenate kinase
MAVEVDVTAAVARARELAASGTRRLLGLAGPPGAGKTTLAELLGRELGAAAALVPMDGFHLADVQLRRLGRLDRKGAPDTYDAAGYVALLRRLRAPERDTVVYAPGFERDLEQPVAASIAVAPDVPLVITEGNYLLLENHPWSAVKDVVDEIWWVDSDPAVRHERLVERHVRFGKSAALAATFVDTVDEANARLAADGRARADLVVRPLPEIG